MNLTVTGGDLVGGLNRLAPRGFRATDISCEGDELVLVARVQPGPLGLPGAFLMPAEVTLEARARLRLAGSWLEATCTRLVWRDLPRWVPGRKLRSSALIALALARLPVPPWVERRDATVRVHWQRLTQSLALPLELTALAVTADGCELRGRIAPPEPLTSPDQRNLAP